MHRLLTTLTTLLLCAPASLGLPSSDANEPVRSGRVREAADQPTVRVEVRVTAVAGGQVYLDAGRDQGLEPGDEVRLFPLGRPEVRAVIRAVSKSSSRADLAGSTEGVEIGVLGEVLVPEDRLVPDEPPPKPAPGEQPPAAPPAAGAPKLNGLLPVPTEVPTAGAAGQDVPEHPPWEQSTESWDQEQPLLAPIRALEPEERETRLRGRFYTRFDLTNDDSSGQSNTYQSARAGVDLEWSNPFGRGGALQLDADGFQRKAEIEGQPDDDESEVRVDRLSYRWGGNEGDPERWEVGRFLHSAFPELGVIDGVEWIRQRESGSSWGASAGLLPEWTDAMDTGDDVQASLFWRHVSGPEEKLALGAAYQKTWHDGEADRDLFVGTVDWHPGERTSVFGTAWVDWYGSDAVIKSSGPELTQLNVNVSHRFESGAGLGLFLTDLRQPELLRNEFGSLPPETIADYHLTRVGVNGWKQLNDTVRLSGRVDEWTDEDTSDVGGEVRVGARDWLYDGGEVSAALFRAGGKFSQGTGLRLGADKRLGTGWVKVLYELTDFDQQDFTGTQASLLQHVLRGSYDKSFGKDWSFSVNAEQRFGDEQDSTTLGLQIQKRIR